MGHDGLRGVQRNGCCGVVTVPQCNAKQNPRRNQVCLSKPGMMTLWTRRHRAQNQRKSLSDVNAAVHSTVIERRVCGRQIHWI
jgi:hypothetical protein